MKEKLMQLLQNPTGDASSRRFGGLEILQFGLFLAFIGGAIFLYRGQNQDFLTLINTLFFSAAALLGVTTLDHIFKPKEKNKKDKNKNV